MWNLFKENLIDWAKKPDRLQKLQHFYAFVAVVSLLVAGLVNFLNQKLANEILIISKYSTLAFVVNLISVNLFEALVLAKIKTLKPIKNKK